MGGCVLTQLDGFFWEKAFILSFFALFVDLGGTERWRISQTFNFCERRNFKGQMSHRLVSGQFYGIEN